jgi:hypothetical protein
MKLSVRVALWRQKRIKDLEILGKLGSLESPFCLFIIFSHLISTTNWALFHLQTNEKKGSFLSFRRFKGSTPIKNVI